MRLLLVLEICIYVKKVRFVIIICYLPAICSVEFVNKTQNEFMNLNTNLFIIRLNSILVKRADDLMQVFSKKGSKSISKCYS